MKIMFEIGHPAHVHTFKNLISMLIRNGHDVKICAIDKDKTLALLRAVAFEYECLGINKSGNLISKFLLLLKAEYRMLTIARRFRPDLFVSRASPVSAHISRFLNKPHIVFNDTECASFIDMVTIPFSDIIFTPSCFTKDYGRKHVRFEGYKELAYLHPNHFEPDPSVLGDLGLAAGDRFIILRFVAWQATHDIRQRGLDIEIKRKLIKDLKKYARIFITSESALPGEFEKYGITIPPEKMHDLLYHAVLYIGEGATMATEAAVLGTPSIYVSTLSNNLGNLVELEHRYGLCYSFRDPEKAMQKAIELLQLPDSKNKWLEKRRRLLADKIDVTQLMIGFIDDYPRSLYKFRQARSNLTP